MSEGGRITGGLLALALGIATAVGWSLISHAPRLDPVVLIALWVNVGVILVGLGTAVNRHPYSLHLLHMISMFLFLGAASLLQYSRGVLGVPGPIATVEPQLLTATAATTFWMAGYLPAYELRRISGARAKAGLLNRDITITRVFLLSGIAIIGLAYLATAGMLGVSTRAGSEIAIENFAVEAGSGRFFSPIYIVMSNLARALPPVALLATLLVLFRNPRRVSLAIFPFVALIGIGTMLLNNPFAASRMFFTSSIIAFVCPFFLRRFRTGWFIVFGVIGGLTVLPALGSGSIRLALDFRDVIANFEIGSPLAYLAANSDVDSLGMTALCQKWVDRFGHRWGLQILGAMLFWVPRAFWPGKPIGTGTMVTEDLGFAFTNLSPPITAEALLNFGLLGVPFMGAAFGWLLARLDGIYWAPGRSQIRSSYRVIDAVYPFWLTCIVFVTRGDLFPSTTFTVSYTIWIVPLGLGLMRFRAIAKGSGSGGENQVALVRGTH